MKGNKTNHPPKRGPYKDDKEKRIVRRTFALTVADDHALQFKAKALGLSLNDWLAEQINRPA